MNISHIFNQFDIELNKKIDTSVGLCLNISIIRIPEKQTALDYRNRFTPIV